MEKSSSGIKFNVGRKAKTAANLDQKAGTSRITAGVNIAVIRKETGLVSVFSKGSLRTEEKSLRRLSIN